MADYLCNSYNYLRSLTAEQIFLGEIEWDPYRIAVDFKEHIISINPVLSEEEF